MISYLLVMDTAFADIDENKNNTIERKELKRALKNIGYNFSDSQVTAFFLMVDENNSGTVELEEFHTLSLFLRLSRVQFILADADRNGSITFQEFGTFLASAGVDSDDELSRQMFEALDVSKKNRLNFEEFVSLLLSIVSY